MRHWICIYSPLWNVSDHRPSLWSNWYDMIQRLYFQLWCDSGSQGYLDSLTIGIQTIGECLLYHPHKEVVGWVGGGGVYWFHCVRPSVHPSICLSRIPCLLCSAYSSGWIHFIFIHLIKQLQKVCHMHSFLQHFKIFGNFFKFVNLTLSCFDLGSDVNP